MTNSIYFRHEKIREEQKRLINDIISCFDEKKHMVAHAPTGLGKTDSALSPAIKYAIENNRTIFFCTPKISQHKIAIETVKGIADKYNLNIIALDMVGKKHLCIDSDMKELGTDEFYEFCRKKKKDEKCPYFTYSRGYSLVQKAKAKLRIDRIKKWHSNAKEHFELLDECKKSKDGNIETPLCAYETALQVGENANIIICDYHHILNPKISDSFLPKIGKELENSILIIDEAHNSPEKLRNAMSFSIDSKAIVRAMQESRVVGNNVLARELDKLGKCFDKAEVSLEKEERIMFKNELPVFEKQFLNELYQTGIIYLENSGKHRSSCLRILGFCESWMNDSDAYLRLIKKTKAGTKIHYKCLDPSIVTAERLNSTDSTIIMSGTLKPGEMYRDLLGLDKKRTVVKEYFSPFPKENQLNIISKNITTKFEERTEKEFEKIGEMISKIIKATPGNTAVFFPSYKVMDEVKINIESDRPVLIQEVGQKPEDTARIIKKFKGLSEEEGAVLIGVSGGSFAEGIDFPGKQLLTAVIVGIPLPEPDLETKALIKYYDMKFGKGWEYGYSFPAMGKVIQAAGRVIRNETDRGVIVFMDKRFAWSKYSKCFPSYYDFTITDNPEKEIRKFFQSSKII